MKILIAVSVVTVAVLLFLIAPRTAGGADMTAFQGVSFAHRGYFSEEEGIPENSLPSFELAVEKGCGIELDIQLSSDGVAMVFHDADLERMCGVEGKIWEYTCSELQQMSLMGTEYTIPTLEQTLAVIDGQVPLLVEYKMDRVDTTVCAVAQAQLDDYSGDYCVQAFDPRALLWYRQNAPQVARGQLAEEFWHSEEFAGSPLHTALSFMVANVLSRPDFISYNYEHSDNISLKLCRLMGAETACYTLKTAEDYAAAKDVFDMYFFDCAEITVTG